MNALVYLVILELTVKLLLAPLPHVRMAELVQLRILATFAVVHPAILDPTVKSRHAPLTHATTMAHVPLLATTLNVIALSVTAVKHAKYLHVHMTLVKMEACAPSMDPVIRVAAQPGIPVQIAK